MMEIKRKRQKNDQKVPSEKQEQVNFNNQKQKKTKKQSDKRVIPTKKLAFRLLRKVVLTGIILWAVIFFVMGIHVNHDNNMYPALRDGDLCFTYKLDRYIAEDLVAYRAEDSIHFGRIIALAGDTVDIKENGVQINGSMSSEKVLYDTTAEGSKIKFPYTVPENTVFVLNDFRDLNSDSRSYGAIPVKKLDGKVVLLIRRRGL